MDDFNTDLPDLGTALAMLAPTLRRQGFIIERPCPVILAIYPSTSLGRYEIYVEGKFTRISGFASGTEPEFAVRVPLGSLNLHQNHEDSAKILVPRVDEATMFHNFSDWLWGWQPPEIAKISFKANPLPSRVLDLALHNPGNP